MSSKQAFWVDGDAFLWDDDSDRRNQPKNQKRIFYDQGLLRGWGIFETILAVSGQQNIFLPFWDYHQQRLADSCLKLHIPFPENIDLYSVIKKTVALLVRNQGEKEGSFYRVRLTVTAGEQSSQWWEPGQVASVFVSASATPSPKAGSIQGCFFPKVFPRKMPFSGHKSVSYLPYLMATRFAKVNKVDEAVLCDEDHYVIEGATSNLFFLSGRKLFTPPLSGGCLPGVCRRFVLENAPRIGMDAEEQPVEREDWDKFDAVLSTNAVAGVRQLDVGSKRNLHDVSVMLQDQFFKAVTEK